ncbi:MAG: hypothetical protein M3P30_12075 [Chloroflexota bacterium]|nr:hypothetical protein [Chloroflexota bacterium]
MTRNHWNRSWLGIAAIAALVGVSAACSGGSASHKTTSGGIANAPAAGGSTDQSLSSEAKAETA